MCRHISQKAQMSLDKQTHRHNNQWKLYQGDFCCFNYATKYTRFHILKMVRVFPLILMKGNKCVSSMKLVLDPSHFWFCSTLARTFCSKTDISVSRLNILFKACMFSRVSVRVRSSLPSHLKCCIGP